MSFSHWLVDENRGACNLPRITIGKIDAADGIPVTGPKLFSPKGHQIASEWKLPNDAY